MRQILLPDVVLLCAITGFGADVVDDNLEVHLSLATETLDIGQEVTLVGPDGAAQGVVVLKGGPEAEWKNGGAVEAAGDHTGVVAGGRLGIRADEAAGVLVEVLRD